MQSGVINALDLHPKGLKSMDLVISKHKPRNKQTVLAFVYLNHSLAWYALLYTVNLPAQSGLVRPVLGVILPALVTHGGGPASVRRPRCLCVCVTI